MVEFAYFGQTRTATGSTGAAGRTYEQQHGSSQPDMTFTPEETEAAMATGRQTVSRQTTDAGRRQELSPVTPSTGRQAPPRPGASTGQRVLTFFTDVTRSLIPGGSTGAGAPVTMPSTTMPSTQSWSPLTLQPAVLLPLRIPGTLRSGAVMKYVLIGGGVLLAIGAAIAAAKLLKKKEKV